MIELHITESGIIKTEYTNKGVVTSHVTFPDETHLPEPVRSQLAALKLMADQTDVMGLGHKVSDSIYWIYDLPNWAGYSSEFISLLALALSSKRPIYSWIKSRGLEGDYYEVVQ